MAACDAAFSFGAPLFQYKLANKSRETSGRSLGARSDTNAKGEGILVYDYFSDGDT